MLSQIKGKTPEKRICNILILKEQVITSKIFECSLRSSPPVKKLGGLKVYDSGQYKDVRFDTLKTQSRIKK